MFTKSDFNSNSIDTKAIYNGLSFDSNGHSAICRIKIATDLKLNTNERR